MEITLLRHGKPNSPSLDKLSVSAFCEWVMEYNASGLCPSSKPTMKAFRYAQACNAIVCSELPRSIESAKVLNAGSVVLSSSIFNEAGLPMANWHTIKLSPKIWAVTFSENSSENRVRSRNEAFCWLHSSVWHAP